MLTNIMSKTHSIGALLLIIFAACLPSFTPSAFSQAVPPKTTTAAPGGAPTQTDALNRSTPSGCVFGFLEAAQSGNYAIAAQYLQLSPARRQTEGERLAQELKTAMDRALAGSLKNVSTKPEGASQEGVPPDKQNLGLMSSGDEEAELILVRVTDATYGKTWLISSETLSKIPELYDQVEARQVVRKLPPWLVQHQFAGMELWQWVALIVSIPLAVGAAWLLLFILQFPARWWARRHGHDDALQIRSIQRPVWMLSATVIHKVFASYLAMPLLQRHYYSEATAVFIIASSNWILWRVIRWFLHSARRQALMRGHGGTGSLMLLVERMVKAAIFVMTLFFIFGVLGFNLTTALAGVGIGTLAVGFGAQQTIANLFGGVSVLGDEVIQVGDVCRFGDRVGTVEDIGLRSTRVRTEERTLLAIPNGTVATINVENLSRREKMLFKTILPLHSDTTQQRLSAVLAEIRRVLAGNPKIESSSARVRLIEITAAAINIELACYVMTRDFDEYANVREDVLLRIMNLVEDAGTSMASSGPNIYVNSDAGPTREVPNRGARENSGGARTSKIGDGKGTIKN